jgi:hypothetical protein
MAIWKERNETEAGFHEEKAIERHNLFFKSLTNSISFTPRFSAKFEAIFSH